MQGDLHIGDRVQNRSTGASGVVLEVKTTPAGYVMARVAFTSSGPERLTWEHWVMRRGLVNVTAQLERGASA